MDLKKPLTIDEQVDRLISHNMIIGDIDTAKKTLSEINYYRFSGYALQFRDSEHSDDYNVNTKFEDVLYLHNFDNRLRCVLRRYLDMVEIYAWMEIS